MFLVTEHSIALIQVTSSGFNNRIFMHQLFMITQARVKDKEPKR